MIKLPKEYQDLELGIDVTPAVKAPSKPAEFFDVNFINKSADEALSAAGSVSAYAKQADQRAIDLAALDVTEYSDTVRQMNEGAANNFFNVNNVDEPKAVVDKAKGIQSAKLETVSILFTPGHGVVDCFQTELLLSISKNDFRKARQIKVLRADLGPSRDVKDLSIAGLFYISPYNSSKGTFDQFSNIERIATENNQGSNTAPIKNDPLLNMRSDVLSSEPRAALNQSDISKRMSVKALAGIVDEALASKIDPSVAYDINTISRIRNVIPKSSPVIHIANSSNEIETGIATKDRTISNNNIKFKEVVLSSIAALNVKELGDAMEIRVVDKSVVRGMKYAYYATFIDDKETEGRRTESTQIVIDNQIPPKSPDVIVINARDYVSLTMTCDRIVEKIEVYRNNGSGWEYIASPPNPDKFIQFIDKDIKQGNSYTYRVYAIDYYGNKSQNPSYARADIPIKHSPTKLKQLSVDADVDQKSKYAFVDIRVDDSKIKGIFINRRDITLSEKPYTIPTTPSTLDLSFVDNKRTFTIDPIEDPANATNFFIRVSEPKLYKFIDYTSKKDHTYQYRIYGVDENGHQTEFSYTRPVFINNRPLVEAPAMLSASISDTGISVSWVESNRAISYKDMLGDREELAATSVRNLYQIQRKTTDVGSQWQEFPIIDTPSFSDAFNRNVVGYPAPPKEGKTYIYRVATFQTGNNYSNYTEPYSVYVPYKPVTLGPISVKCSDTSVNPMYIIVGWNSDNPGGVWVIERAVVNNVGARSYSNVARAKLLHYEKVAEVTHEASRANSRDIDGRRRGANFTTKRYFIDGGPRGGNVIIGNTYFYKVYAIDGNNKVGEPSYGAVSVTNKTLDRVTETALTDKDRRQLAQSDEPVSISGIINPRYTTTTVKMRDETLRPDRTIITKIRGID